MKDHLQDTLNKEDPDYDRYYPSYKRFPPQALCALYMPWEHKPTPLSDALPSMVFFTQTEYGIGVAAEKNLPGLLRRYATYPGKELIAVMPGDAKVSNKILKRFATFRSEKSKNILNDTPEVREYIEDIQLLYPDLNDELIIEWTPEMREKMVEPLSYYGKMVHMVLRCGDEVVVIKISVRSDIAERPGFGFPDLTTYNIKDREAQPELLACVVEGTQEMTSQLNRSLSKISLTFSYGNQFGKDGKLHNPVHPYSNQVEEVVGKLNAESPVTDYIRTWFNYHAKANVWEGSKKTCSIPECDWHADPTRGAETGYCIVHYYQHRHVAWQRSPPKWLRAADIISTDPRLVQHVYLLRRREQKGECKANDCTRPQLSADGLCNAHKREEMNGFPFSLDPPISYDGYTGRDDGFGIRSGGVYEDHQP